jgi:hypothetical protein
MPMNEVVESGADITVASTTETQAELDHATSPNWREHFDPAKVAEKKDEQQSAEADKKNATKTEAGSGPAKTEAKSGKEKDDDDGDLSPGARKRIDKLTARWKAAEDELAALRRGEKPASARETVQSKTATDSDPEPKENDPKFKSWDEWNAAHNRWLVRDEKRTLDAKEASERQAAEDKETYDGHLARIQSFTAEHDDFEESVKDMGSFEFASTQSNMAFQLAIVEADNGPDIMYHLAKNPEEMEKFQGLSPVKVQMLVGRLSAKLQPDSSTANDKDKDKNKETAAASTKKKSNAPEPTEPVRRSSAAPATSLDDPKMSTDEWIRKRNEQERKNRRR